MYMKLVVYSSLLVTISALTYDYHHRYEQWSKLESHQWYTHTRLENQHFLNESSFDRESVPLYPFYLKIEKSSIPVLQVNAFKQCPTVKGVFLSDIHINTISPGVFDGLEQLTEIDLSKNELTHVEDGVFNKAQELISLDLSYNSIKNVSEKSFSGLKNLKYLYLQDNEISFLCNDLFESQVNSLLRLDLSSNKLKEINTTFNGMSQLTHLYLKMNSISQIDPESLRNLTSLECLDVSHNNIQHIALALELKKLNNLSLQNNKIPFLDPNFFGVQKNSLKILNMSSNSLKKINTVFHGMSLSHLYLQGNDISTLAPDSFQNLTSLQYLDLSHNSIRDPPEHIFSGSDTIAELYLQNNKITFLSSNLFESQKHSLVLLNLSSNTLREINTVFRGLHNLTNLHLQENQISSTAPNSLQDLSSLEYLDISHNNIERFQYGLLDHLDRLKYLNFSYNRFEEFPFDHLGYLTNLQELIFDNNKIKSLNGTEIIHHFPSLKQIGMSGNFNWSCIRLVTFVKKLRLKKVDILKGNYFTGDNVRGMACYEDDSVPDDKYSKNDAQDKHTDSKELSGSTEKYNNENSPKYTDKNVRDLINAITEKDGHGNTFITILITIITVALVVKMIFQFLFVFKLKRNTREEHLQLL